MKPKKAQKSETLVFVEVSLDASASKCARDGVECRYLKKQKVYFAAPEKPNSGFVVGHCGIFHAPVIDYDGTGYMNRCKECMDKSATREVSVATIKL